MSLQDRWLRQNPEQPVAAPERSPAQVFDIATGKPVTAGLKPVREWSWVARAGVATVAITAAIAVVNGIGMRSWEPPRTGAEVSRAKQVATAPRPGDIALPVTLPDALASIAASDAAEPAAPPEAEILPPQGTPVLAEPLAPEQSSAPSPRKTATSSLVFDAAAQADGAGDASIVLDGGRKAVPVSDSEQPTSRSDARATLTKGTQVPAVLESVIDTRAPGTVRAVVGVDVRSADGRTLLVARSSRLVGQYRSERGRAYVIWTQLTRPDGTEQRLASPGNDSRFMARYAEAPLVSVVGDARASSDGVRVRRGEPIRVVAARNLPMSAGR